ncbi:Chondroitin sulfate N-acetylgalactosaminyltransferase 1 [Halocaridina rubra]|uniref:Hexosyltransferase n=1 Tax=Halocaridina rubra TaxID=373956 RepID=A0AAN8XVC6_HALRR
MVNIVVTLRGRLDKYALFLDHLVQRVLPTDQNLSLTIIYFADAHTLEAKEMTRSKLGTIPKFHWSFVPLEDENFSRGKGLHVGAQTINHKSAEESKQGSRQSGNEILFFCDVDVLMHPNFFDHCRSNTLQGHQVYYPVVFSLYNPKLVYPLFDKGVPGVDGQLTISDESGFWRVFGFGMTCMYSSDYEASGGFPDIKTWGGEDEALYEKFLQMKNIKVLRSPDPSLFHLYHQKECLDITSTSYPACLKSKALTEGSQLQLGLALLKLHEGIDMEGILSKRPAPYFSEVEGDSSGPTNIDVRKDTTQEKVIITPQWLFSKN